MSRVVIVSAGIAAGHDGAARELARRLDRMGLQASVHDLLDFLPAGFGSLLRGAYRTQLRVAPKSWQWLYSMLEQPRLTGLGDLTARVASSRLESILGPDVEVAVSTYPIAGRALGRLRRSGRLRVPAVAYLTDMAVHPLWVADGVDLHLAIHAEPAAQARAHGAGRVAVVSPAVSPAFRAAADNPGSRAALGLPAGRRLALVVAGSWGVGDVERTAADIEATGKAVPVVVCGDNAALASRLRSTGRGVVLGWTDQMPQLIASCDVVVQNAGGLTSLEAIAAGTPLVSYRCVSGHGVVNSRSLCRAGLAPFLEGPAQLAAEFARLFAAPAAETGSSAGQALFAGADPAAVIAALAGQHGRPTAPAFHPEHAYLGAAGS